MTKNTTKVWYKIVDQEKGHYGLYYEKGINKDPEPLPFDEIRSCGRGAIYFTDAKNLHWFLSYGETIATLTVPGEYIRDSDGEKWKAHEINITKFQPANIKNLLSIPGINRREMIISYYGKTDEMAMVQPWEYKIIRSVCRTDFEYLKMLKDLDCDDQTMAKMIVKHGKKLPQTQLDEITDLNILDILFDNGHWEFLDFDFIIYQVETMKQLNKVIRMFGLEKVKEYLLDRQ